MTKLQTCCMVLVFCGPIVITAPAKTLTTLHTFDWNHGAWPVAGLVQGTDGNFYGTTQNGGADSAGTVFKITPGGTFTMLYSFHGADGAGPSAALIQATDGNFYGTTIQGGGSSNCMFGCGTIFKITPSGTLTTLYKFQDSDGAQPYAALVQATDGNFYGTTVVGGTNEQGTIFKITPGGSLTTIYRFQGCEIDGSNPFSTLIQATDGDFYGTTTDEDCIGGTVFKITAGGALTTVHTFDPQTDGAFPYAGLIQATDGNFYGTTEGGGPGQHSEGTVFKMTPGGTLTLLHTFHDADGGSPLALIQASDGNFYGAANYDGRYGYGTLFEVTPTGGFATLYAFGAFGGQDPAGILPNGVIQATDGNFYGTTGSGGRSDFATVFRLVTQRACIFCASAE